MSEGGRGEDRRRRECKCVCASHTLCLYVRPFVRFVCCQHNRSLSVPPVPPPPSLPLARLPLSLPPFAFLFFYDFRSLIEGGPTHSLTPEKEPSFYLRVLRPFLLVRMRRHISSTSEIATDCLASVSHSSLDWKGRREKVTFASPYNPRLKATN